MKYFIGLFLLLGARPLGAQAADPAVSREIITTVLQHAAVLEPSVEYRTWWDSLVAHCDCVPAATFAEMVWLVVPGRTFRCGEGQCRGEWVAETQQIILASSYTHQENVVKHEMLHAILGTADHGPLFLRLRLIW